MRRKKRPQYLEKFIAQANDYFREFKIQDYYKDSLFNFLTCRVLTSANGYYRGFNFHMDKYVTVNGEQQLVRALTGPPEKLPQELKDQWYIQIW